jgi:hypothetical protein
MPRLRRLTKDFERLSRALGDVWDSDVDKMVQAQFDWLLTSLWMMLVFALSYTKSKYVASHNRVIDFERLI